MDERAGTEIHVEQRANERGAERRGGMEGPAGAEVRAEDLEPHHGLRYIAKLFKFLSIFLVIMLVAEIVIGLAQGGAESIPALVVSATRLIVFAAFLWGAGDLALMMIESTHDQRANRILLGRLNHKMQRMVEIEADELELLAANPARKLGEPEPPRR